MASNQAAFFVAASPLNQSNPIIDFNKINDFHLPWQQFWFNQHGTVADIDGHILPLQIGGFEFDFLTP